MAGLRWNQLISTAALTALVACGGGEKAAPPAASTSAVAGSDLTPWQLENGIGPITEPLALGPIDKDEAAEGEKIFVTNCSACHKLGERYVGPPLGGITEKVTPEFAMNMILNPQEMYTRHPVVKKLLGEYMTQMPNQGLTQEQAREVVEYLRTTPPPAPAP
jgi:mono/diheme cytochrome c family protein